MRAVVHDTYGSPDVLRVENVERPAPQDDEILVKIHATTVNRTDCHLRAADPFLWRLLGGGFLRPAHRILGTELAGVVEEAGAAVTAFAVGDEVFGVYGKFGTHAEYVCVPENGRIAHKPAALSFEEAAAVCDGGLAALTSLRRAGLRAGQRVLVYGASGSVGTAAVQLARHFGAHVTAVCNTKNVELVGALGADEVIDYLHEDFTRNGQTYDIVVDAVGKHSFRRCRSSLNPGGIYAATDLGFMWHVPLLAVLTKRIGDRKVSFAVTRTTKADVLLLRELVEAGEYRPVIDRIYPLEDVVEATRYVETHQKTGNVVLTVIGGER
jgi:NADPH:quinone reductase-like Zn-dependent oxidoreductase